MTNNNSCRYRGLSILPALCTILCVFVLGLTASAQSGGPYTITQSVIAGGGNTTSSGGTFTLSGTTGQPAAFNSGEAPYILRGGFWQAELETTAAEVAVAGRILTANGAGIKNVIVTLTTANGTTFRTLSSSFGYYRFDGLQAGETCIISIASRRFTFSTTTRTVTLNDSVSDLDFTALPF
ncbi:MAG: hypothetical protein UZ17_ACD001002287 [Acidobacteria bacterium OLB17]|nr:MAG: hypothetical protein UZ17_ACD001002287 [Acidobacteria bacterium OLB17]MCZ2389800.1 carboxypeptidase-like regulatory domain-containing protein [Acidobacteriota bacterium]